MLGSKGYFIFRWRIISDSLLRSLKSWKPYIIVVTGSSGRTTLLHLIESQIGDKAKYSHHTNSAYGIPFDISAFTEKFKTYRMDLLIFGAPFSAFRKPPEQVI